MSAPTPYSYRIREVTRVLDGDTIDCIIDLGFDMMMEARVRLSGVDAPATRTRDLEEKKFGLYATDWLSNRLKGDIIITTEYDKEKGKYGRVLGTLWADGVNLNHQMIVENVAVAYDGGNKEDLEAMHLANRQILTEKGLV